MQKVIKITEALLFVVISAFMFCPVVLSSVSLSDSYDVIVFGAGTGGVSAAIQAARMGVRVALVEESGWAGGQMTAVGVMPVDGGGWQLNNGGGIYKEFRDKVLMQPEYRGKDYALRDSLRVEPHVGMRVLKEMLIEAGISESIGNLLFYQEATAIQRQGQVSFITLKDRKTGNSNTLAAKLIIDATEYGDVIGISGARTRIGNYIYRWDENIQKEIPVEGPGGLPIVDPQFQPQASIQDFTYPLVIKKYRESQGGADPVPPYLRINNLSGEEFLKLPFIRFESYQDCNRNIDPACIGGRPANREFSSVTYGTNLYQEFCAHVSAADRDGQQPDFECRYPDLYQVPPSEAPDDNWKFPWAYFSHNNYRGMSDSTNPDNYSNLTVDGKKRITKTSLNFANDFPAEGVYSGGGLPYKLQVNFLTDRKYRKQAICAGKIKTFYYLYYLQNKIPSYINWSVSTDEGFADTVLDDDLCRDEQGNYLFSERLRQMEKNFPAIPYIREGRRIVGLHTLTGSEIKRTGRPLRPGGLPVAATKFPSAIAVGDYNLDLHNADDASDLEPSLGDTNLTREEILASGPFQVPFECLIPADDDGLLAAEKNISVSRLVNGAIRLHPITMLTGQAAGAIAAEAIRLNLPPRKVPVIVVQKDLLDAGSGLSLYEFIDVPKSNPYWEDVELASLYGIFIGYGNGYFGISDSLTRVQAALVLTRAFIDTASDPLYGKYQGYFQDVLETPDNAWYRNEIEAIFRAGFTSGCSTNPRNYCPHAVTLRTQMAVFLTRALGLNPEEAPTEKIFADVDSAYWGFKYIQILASMGIIEPDYLGPAGEQFFMPDDPIKRGDAARWLMRAFYLKRSVVSGTDTTAPATTDRGIDGVWHNGAVTFSLSATDTGSGVDKTYYSIDASFPSVLYTGPVTISQEGNFTIKYYSIDMAGNKEKVKTAAKQVKIDQSPPVVSRFVINNNAAQATAGQVNLGMAVTDALNGMGAGAQMQFSNDNVTYAAAEPYAATKAWNLSSGTGVKIAYAKFKDAAGNWSSVASDSIVLSEATVDILSGVVRREYRFSWRGYSWTNWTWKWYTWTWKWPVFGASIKLRRNGQVMKIARSNWLGRYTIWKVPAGTYEMQITSGNQTYQENVSLANRYELRDFVLNQ